MNKVFVVQGLFKKEDPKLLRVFKSKENAERYVKEQTGFVGERGWSFDITEMVLED